MSSAPQPSERHKQLALHHANIIQQRKDVEMATLEALEELLDFPTQQGATPERPNPNDISRVVKLMQTFTPTDFDSLVDERSAADECGYVFCPGAPKRDPTKAKTGYILWGRKGEPIKHVPAREVELWCSKACCRRAMYIKVQLDELPAWQRPSDKWNDIEVLKQNEDDEMQRMMNELSLGIVDRGSLEKAMSELALERGEKKDSVRMTSVMSSTVKENESIGAAVAPSRTPGDAGLGSVEGFAPTWTPSKK